MYVNRLKEAVCFESASYLGLLVWVKSCSLAFPAPGPHPPRLYWWVPRTWGTADTVASDGLFPSLCSRKGPPWKAYRWPGPSPHTPLNRPAPRLGRREPQLCPPCWRWRLVRSKCPMEGNTSAPHRPKCGEMWLLSAKEPVIDKRQAGEKKGQYVVSVECHETGQNL